MMTAAQTLTYVYACLSQHSSEQQVSLVPSGICVCLGHFGGNSVSMFLPRALRLYSAHSMNTIIRPPQHRGKWRTLKWHITIGSKLRSHVRGRSVECSSW